MQICSIKELREIVLQLTRERALTKLKGQQLVNLTSRSELESFVWKVLKDLDVEVLLTSNIKCFRLYGKQLQNAIKNLNLRERTYSGWSQWLLNNTTYKWNQNEKRSYKS